MELWQDLKAKFIREIKPRFEDIRQPKYNITFDEAFTFFKQVIQFKFKDKLKSNLEEHLIGTLHKYLTQKNDHIDYLAQYTQIATSFEPFLKKVIRIIEPKMYADIQVKRPGKKMSLTLGKAFEILDKLDKKEQRYLENIYKVKDYPFGKEIWTVYNRRNETAHTAREWSKDQIHADITKMMTALLFVVFEYKEEISVFFAKEEGE